jgi:hypothetical protein
METVRAMKISAPVRTWRSPATDIKSAVANFKQDALPHFYSLGSAGNTLAFKIGLPAFLLNAFATVGTTLISGLAIFGLARRAGVRQEQATVNDIARLVGSNPGNKDILRQEMADLKSQPRLSRLLEQRGVVI